MIKKNKNHLFIALTIVVIIIIISIIVIMLFSPIIFDRKNGSKSYISVNYNSSQSLEISEKLPVSDSLGKSFSVYGIEKGVFGYLEFDVVNNSNEEGLFQIYVKNQSSVKELSGNYIKFYLTDENDNPYELFDVDKVPTFNNLSSISDISGSRELYHGKIGVNKIKKFKLRVWLSDDYIISDNNKVFNFVVNVRAI